MKFYSHFDYDYHENFLTMTTMKKLNFIHIMMEKHSFHKYFLALYFFFFFLGGGGGGVGRTNHRVFHLCSVQVVIMTIYWVTLFRFPQRLCWDLLTGF